MGILSGEGAIREVASYYVGGGDSNVPWATLVEIVHPIFQKSSISNLIGEEQEDIQIENLINPEN